MLAVRNLSIPYVFLNTTYSSQVPDAGMPYIPGHEETGFLQSLRVSVNDIEFLASNCTKVSLSCLHYLNGELLKLGKFYNFLTRFLANSIMLPSSWEYSQRWDI